MADREEQRKQKRIQSINNDIARFRRWIDQNEAQIARGVTPQVEQVLNNDISRYQSRIESLLEELANL